MSYRIIRKSTHFVVRFYRNGKVIPELSAEWATEKKAIQWGELIANA